VTLQLLTNKSKHNHLFLAIEIQFETEFFQFRPFPCIRYLVPGDLTVCQFMCVIRKRIKLEPEKAMFFFVNDSRNNHNVAPLQSALLSAIYDQYKDEDGFLYITYSGETTFG